MHGSAGFVARSLFLSFMMSVMCLGSGWFTFLSLPLGMQCLSARRMRLVRSLFAECTLSRVEVPWSEVSISAVQSFQLAFLQFVDVLLLGVSLKLVLVLIFMIIGRWSEDKDVLVFQVVRLARLEDMEVISGEVSCWVVCEGVRVCVFSLRMTWSEPWSSEVMTSPLWSGVGECQSCE